MNSTNAIKLQLSLMFHKLLHIYYIITFYRTLTEIFWKSKDRFDATSFYRNDIVFKRNADGKVTEMVFEPENGNEPIRAIKM